MGTQKDERDLFTNLSKLKENALVYTTNFIPSSVHPWETFL